MNSFFEGEYKEYILEQGRRYWPKGREYISGLPICCTCDCRPVFTLPPMMTMIELPSWAKDSGVNGALLVPEMSISRSQPPLNLWEKTDWFFVAFWYLSGLAEYEKEKMIGPIHSYSFKLKGWDKRIWKSAWVNRIFLFLRRWAAKEQKKDEDCLFGSLPDFNIHLTHDVDAVSKTLPIRLKQSAFHFYNGFRCLIKKQYRAFGNHILKTLRFLLLPCNYWCFQQIQDLEEKYGVAKSCFNIFAGDKSSSVKNWFFNPAYNLNSPHMSAKIRALLKEGYQIGLHQGFDNWTKSSEMKQRKQRIEKITGSEIERCRQHWLKFSWEKTWTAQDEAGFKTDSTLAFNDRPGFRTGAAICYQPWDFLHKEPMIIKALPTVFMDSHFYDYNLLSDIDRKRAIKYWIDEIRTVRGEAAIIWHQRVFAPDYGWDNGYEYVLQEITK